MNYSKEVKKIAEIIYGEFENYLSKFFSVTRRAKIRFEERDWKGARSDAIERLSLYEKVLSKTLVLLNDTFPDKIFDQSIWKNIKEEFAKITAKDCNRNIAETFFNSVTRKTFQTVGINRALEFFYLRFEIPKEPCGPLILTTYKQEEKTKELIRKIITDHKFNTAFDDIERGLELVSNELDLFLWPLIRDNKTYTVEVINNCFYRNKVAYLVGRIAIDSKYIPMVVPLYNDDSGIYIDSVLFDESDVNNIFGFSYSYFHVAVELPNQLITFLNSILPNKPIYELLNAIGFYKHGKTEFYRDLHRFVHLSKEQFEIAPGQEGAVMTVFTLPNYNYVFKVIKDKPCFVRSSLTTDKNITFDQVKYSYNFVCTRDRVGRLVDTQEFENLRFKIKRFSEDLIYEFKEAARNNVLLKEGYVIINHLYLQRKVTPLPIYLFKESNINSIRQAVIDYGYFIKDLAATGLFPADLFNTWNYGVTENNRVVLYDYDDIIPLENANIKLKPTPRDEFEETSLEEDWIIANQNDFFLDEVDKFIGVPESLKGIFYRVHKDLFSMEFWENIKKRVASGEIIDIIPYDRNKRFKWFTREA